MNAERLLNAYANVKHAVVYTEYILCVPPDDGDNISSWDLMMAVNPPMDPQEVAKIIRHSIDADNEGIGKFKEARQEMDHHDFLTYLAGKMGAM